MITQKELKHHLRYDSETGIFTRTENVNSNNSSSGRITGSVSNTGYLVIRVLDVLYTAHRLAWLYSYGSFPSFDVDHINGDRHDNRLSNLRAVTREENMKNKCISICNSSGKTGVSWDSSRNKWAAYGGIRYKKVYIGRFATLSDASDARDKWEKDNGYHANHGRAAM